MQGLYEWFTKNPVAANLLMGLILLAGYLSVTSLRIEGFPAIEVSSVSISVACPGASAEQVDSSLSRRIEQALEDMPGLKKISSFSFSGYALVTVQKKSRFDMDRFQNEIKVRIDALGNLPKNCEKPVIRRDEFTIEALLVQVYGPAEMETLQTSAREVKKALLESTLISKIDTFGYLPFEVLIQADPEKLKSFGLKSSDLVAAVNQNSFDGTQGRLKSDSGQILINTDKKITRQSGFNQIPVKTKPDGSVLKLKDVASVVDGFEPADAIARFQGESTVGMMVFTSQKGDLLKVSRASHDIVDTIRPQLPQGVEIDIWGESSTYMKERLELLVVNAFQGLLIVFILLAVFLNARLAFWVAMGIPISICGTLALMGPRFLDHSLNDITTFGLIIVLGMLVDDAVVVGESVFEQRRTMADPVKGTVKGVSKISTATIFGCLTTITAFFPALLIDNALGKLFAGFSVIVIVSLLFSLIESKLILPAHLVQVRLQRKTKPSFGVNLWSSIQRTAASALQTIILRIYEPLLKTALHHRYSFLILLISLCLVVTGMVLQGKVKSVFFPEIPGQIITVDLKMENGVPSHLTQKTLLHIETAADQVNQDIMKKTGAQKPPIAKILTAMIDSKTGKIYAELQPEKERSQDTLAILEQWRKKIRDAEGVRKLSFSGSFETAGGFEMSVSHPDSQQQRMLVREFMGQISKIKGVKAVYSSAENGYPQIDLKLKEEARFLGLTTSDLALYIGQAFDGVEIQRFFRNTEEVKVKLKYPLENRKYISDLLNTKIQTPTGNWISLNTVADIEYGLSSENITRKNGKRLISIQADLDKTVISPEQLFEIVKNDIQPDLKMRFPGHAIQGEGDIEEMASMKTGMKKALLMILSVIFALIAIPLKSYAQPLIIMSVIPFAFAGAVLGHALMGFPLSILSFLGMLGATGVVVNDSLVLLTRINTLCIENSSFSMALINAGKSRFRAIFLTTATTVCGLAPLMMETSEQAQYLIPAAISLAFGELLATPAALLLVPVLVAVGRDMKQFFKKDRSRLVMDRSF